MSQSPEPTPNPATPGWRRSLRIDVRGQIDVTGLTCSETLTARDFNVWGLLADSSGPLPVGATHRLQLTLRGRSTPLIVDVNVAHCAPTPSNEASGSHIVGFAFRTAFDHHTGDEMPRTDHAIPAARAERRSPRPDATGLLTIESLDWPARLRIRDVSAGGFLVDSSEPLPLGRARQFRFKPGRSEWTATLLARAVHCEPDAQAGGLGYQIGFAFWHDEDSAAVVDRLLQTVIALRLDVTPT